MNDRLIDTYFRTATESAPAPQPEQFEWATPLAGLLRSCYPHGAKIRQDQANTLNALLNYLDEQCRTANTSFDLSLDFPEVVMGYLQDLKYSEKK